jgi:nitrous oxide reductase accessory protein NosL
MPNLPKAMSVFPKHLWFLPLHQQLMCFHLPKENREAVLEDLRREAWDDPGQAGWLVDDEWKPIVDHQYRRDKMKPGSKEYLDDQLMMQRQPVIVQISDAVLAYLQKHQKDKDFTQLYQTALDVLKQWGFHEDEKWLDYVSMYRTMEATLIAEA